MNKKVLVIYYSLQGHTKEVSNLIKDAIGADTFELELEKPYNLVTATTLGSRHTKKDFTPTLKKHVDNIEDYDVIFVGSPIWWYTLTPPVLTFLKEHNLENKTVVPFCTHAGNHGSFFEKFKNNCKGTNIKESKDFHSSKLKDKESLKSEVEEWVQTILKI
ncbi:flavodoxin [Clostridium sp. YIM B02551]|uniref:flavodoxin n=1 Tax=Clostridium sp. YIM B02551 TaxID=2910679 RepID=UPI001EEAB264|nr:flavodoxin [Clostridium sp. YIM B02551]